MRSVAHSPADFNALALKLTPQTRAIYDYLVGNPGREITPQELIQNAWGRSPIPADFNSLWVHMRLLRVALGDKTRPYRVVKLKTMFVDYDEHGKLIRPRAYVYAGDP